ncbi:MAG: effector binding domain-containing protein [Lachnotalea sp.]
MDALNKSIDFMENHLLANITSEDVANSVHMSNFYYQKGFKILTGYTVGEYIRNRRLTLAGMELMQKNQKIIDLAYKYGYETPESFTKAFSRFHGILPSQVKYKSYKLQSFQRLIIKITVEGGTIMDYRIEKKEGFNVLGLARDFVNETAYAELPKYWTEFCQKYCSKENPPIKGMFGICVDGDCKSNTFKYLIADTYQGEVIPEGFEVMEIPSFTWAIFSCVGPMPGALQAVNTRIFSEWLPNNKEYEIATGINIEMYTEGDLSASDYRSEIWIPVKPKNQ